MARRGLLQGGAHRLRRWLPSLTVLWALAAMLAVLHPCREAFAAGLPHGDGVQVVSEAHPAPHHPPFQSSEGCHDGDQRACQCAALAPPFHSTLLDGTALESAPEGSTPAVPEAVSLHRKVQLEPILPRRAPDPATYLATGRLLI
jgi:hypothetical protein